MHYKGQASSSHHYAHATAFPIITYHDDDDDPSSSCLQKKFGLIWCQIPQDLSINESITHPIHTHLHQYAPAMFVAAASLQRRNKIEAVVGIGLYPFSLLVCVK
jgi:hypothetical protein